MARMQNTFTTVRTEGSLLPADFLQRLLTPGSDIEGLRPEDYHLAGRERIDDAASRSWLRLVGAWSALADQLRRLAEDDTATTITREKWLYVLFSELGYGRLEAAKGVTAEGKSYPVSHLWRDIPVHLVGANIDLDRRTRGAAGAATMSPHGLVQELLNRSDDYLWGVVSNGRVLRVLRDNAAMTRQAFVEFDLEAMLEGQEYHDFVLLWMLLHESRLEAERSEECWLEKWVATSRAQGTRALDSLRGGVEAAITALGTGLVSHRSNTALKTALRDGTLDKYDLYRQVLRIVYRLIFLFVAEDRDLVFAPGASREAKDRYLRYYSATRLRRLAERRRGDGHSDLWQQLLLTFRLFATGEGEDPLGVPFYGGLFRDADPVLANSDISNIHLLEAVRALATVTDGKGRRRVDYRNLGAEELGSVYESLLEQHPSLNLETGAFGLGTAAGSERKTTGSYYTPSSLIGLLLDSALEPVLEERLQSARREKHDLGEAILGIRVCDPACGSGHFLIAAAHRLARELAKVRTGDDEPSPSAQRHALRDVVSRCIYGVDLNPMAVELAKVGLWLEAIEPGKPLTFLDHHVKQGNSLLGATPALLERGIPDEAFNPIEGDERRIASSYKARNRAARGGQMDLLAAEEPADYGRKLAEQLLRIDAMPDETAAEIGDKARVFDEYASSADYLTATRIADAYLAAFVWPAVPESSTPITQSVVEGLRDGSVHLESATQRTLEELSATYEWFHWHLEFPDVFGHGSPADETDAPGWSGGFHCVLGNPPWERIKLEEKEFFAAREPSIAEARNAAERKRLISALDQEDPGLLQEFRDAKRAAEGESHIVRASGRFPLSGRGDVNTYSVFTELSRQILSRDGRAGVIVPTGVATDDTTKILFGDLVDKAALVSLLDFENAHGIFPSVHRSYKFCLLTISRQPTDEAQFAFFLHEVTDLADPNRTFELSPADIERTNPNTRNCPIFRSRRDARITLEIHSRLPVVIDESEGTNPWSIRFLRMFDMATDSEQFRIESQLLARGCIRDGNRYSAPGEDWLPLYEAKMMHQFTHRHGDYADLPQGSKSVQLPAIPSSRLARGAYEVQPKYWVSVEATAERLRDWPYSWLPTWRNFARATDRRTMIASLLPYGPTGNNVMHFLPEHGSASAACLLAALNSFACDFVVRQKLGGVNLKYFVFRQIPVPPPEAFNRPWVHGQSLASWVEARVLELTYTSLGMSDFARDLGFDGQPFSWDETRRFELRCELDAAFFHMYGIERNDVDYIMDTFWIVQADDEKRFGEYRTKRRILELFDEYASAGSAS